MSQMLSNRGGLAPQAPAASPAYQDKSIGFRVAEVGLPAPIPAVGTWGLVVTTIALLAAATLAFRRARVA